MKYLDFMSSLHKSTPRDYLSRVNNKEFPKAKAAKLAKKFVNPSNIKMFGHTVPTAI